MASPRGESIDSLNSLFIECQYSQRGDSDTAVNSYFVAIVQTEFEYLLGLHKMSAKNAQLSFLQ